MPSLVSIENESGWLLRYECGGEAIRLTHRCEYGCYVDLRPEWIEAFRLMPPDDFAVEPGPRDPKPGAHMPFPIERAA